MFGGNGPGSRNSWASVDWARNVGVKPRVETPRIGQRTLHSAMHANLFRGILEFFSSIQVYNRKQYHHALPTVDREVKTAILSLVSFCWILLGCSNSRGRKHPSPTYEASQPYRAVAGLRFVLSKADGEPHGQFVWVCACRGLMVRMKPKPLCGRSFLLQWGLAGRFASTRASDGPIPTSKREGQSWWEFRQHQLEEVHRLHLLLVLVLVWALVWALVLVSMSVVPHRRMHRTLRAHKWLLEISTLTPTPRFDTPQVSISF